MQSLVRAIIALMFLFSTPHGVLADDIVELANGAKVRGKVVSHQAGAIVVEVVVGGKTYSRKYDRDIVKSVIVDGSAIPIGTGEKKTARSKTEILAEIKLAGESLPDWFEATKLSYPPTLDLDWPIPPPKGWDNSKNVGQFVWDRINPNPNQWRNGVKLMHHILDIHHGNTAVTKQAMLALGSMYHHLLVDYPRAAYWLQRAGVVNEPDRDVHAGIQLADSYWQLGSKSMAKDVVDRMRRRPLHAIKLLGDMGETEEAIRLAESFSKFSEPVTCFLYAGDVYRVAGNLDASEQYYRKALQAADRDARDNDHAKRDRQRAEASLAAIEFYRLKPTEITDGTYSASSLGYEGQVEVAVQVNAGRITSVNVTKHQEKQFYSSISDTPPRIIAKQGFANVDTVAGATITSEAIINAAAKALAKGKP